MWENFKSMPTLLKFLTAHAIACIFFLIGSVFPHDSYVIHGRPVTHAEWWSSGVGVYGSVLGVLMASAGVLLVLRHPFSRPFYLGIFSLGMTTPYFLFGEHWSSLFSLLVAGLIGAYLYLNTAVKAYFSPHPQQPPNPSSANN